MTRSPLLLLVVACGVDEEIHKGTLDNLKRCQAELADSQAKAGALEREAAAQRAQLDILEGEKGSLSDRLGATRREIDELRQAREAAEKRSKTYRDLLERLHAMIASGQIQVEMRKGKMIVKMSDRILFDPGKPDLKTQGQAALIELATALRAIPDRDFLVAGHTDNVPIKSHKFRSNWELSTARAVEVVKFLQSQGVDPTHLGASGYSEFDPVGDNATDTGRAQNRRIEVVLMPNINELPQISE